MSTFEDIGREFAEEGTKLVTVQRAVAMARQKLRELEDLEALHLGERAKLQRQLLGAAYDLLKPQGK